MHLIKTTNNKLDMAARPPFGPGASHEIVERAALMEVWGSSFKDPGPDYCIFKLFDAAGNRIWEGRVDGY